MPDQSAPVHVFDVSRATPWFPRPVVKWAIRVPVPDNFPTFIQPEWDQTGTTPQVFYGSYYLMLDPHGRGRYGSAAVQWEAMHTQLDLAQVVIGVPTAAYVKIAVPIGYRVTNRCRIATSVPLGGGHVFESEKEVEAGTLILRQPGGEIQHVRAVDEVETYFSNGEAQHLGLHHILADGIFPAWATNQATVRLHASVRV